MTGARRGRLKCEYTEKVFEPNLLRIGWVTTSDEWMWVLGLVLVLLACGLAGHNAAGARLMAWAAGGGAGGGG